jgi:6-phosphogluconate dehydrogenase
MDTAGQKGTGKWSAINALDLGIPATLIGEAVFARCLSSLKTERGRASELLDGPEASFRGDKQAFIDNLEQTLYASKIISYAQGFMLIQNAAKEYRWKLNMPEIALMWRGGCIIRSVFLKDITKAFRENTELDNLLFSDFFRNALHGAQAGWRDVVSKGSLWGIPMPAFSTALSFYDGYRTRDCSANLLQAQRDYFGAHTFRIKPEYASEKYKEGTDIHVNWTGRGGSVSASVSLHRTIPTSRSLRMPSRLTTHNRSGRRKEAQRYLLLTHGEAGTTRTRSWERKATFMLRCIYG